MSDGTGLLSKVPLGYSQCEDGGDEGWWEQLEEKHWSVAGRWDVGTERISRKIQYSCWVRNGEMNLQMENKLV